MRRFAAHSLLALLFVTASAVLDAGPRASAGYLSRADESASSGVAADEPAGEAPDFPAKFSPDDGDSPCPREGVLAGRGMSAGAGPGANGAPAGGAPVADNAAAGVPPAGGLVSYFREPPGSLDLTHFSESLLDPPRLRG